MKQPILPLLPRSQSTLQRPRMSLALLVTGCFLLLACTAPQPKKRIVEAPPPVPATQPEDNLSAQAPKLPPPELTQVRDVVRRVFKDAAVVDDARNPSFISGDFNGDQSTDLAVVLKPVGDKLSEMNQEFPPWILKDPLQPHQPGGARGRVTEDEELLAVIHGYGPNGWTDPEATQTYLLKNVVGSGMQMHSAKELVNANRKTKVPRINGDVIAEVLRGTSGYLYYGGATYSWYDPKTFKEESPGGVFHSGMRGNAKPIREVMK